MDQTLFTLFIHMLV